MGYEGGPIEPLGVWGKHRHYGKTCNGVGFSAISIVLQGNDALHVCPTLREI